MQKKLKILGDCKLIENKLIENKLIENKLIENKLIENKLIENNISSLKPVQIESLKHEKGNIFIESPTGSGKTLAYLLPIFKCLTENPSFGFQVLIVVPTKELSKQISSVVSSFGFRCTLNYERLNNERLNYERLNNEKSEDTEILIATPGVSNFLKSNYFKNLKFLVLDEGDKLYNDFSISINSILKIKFERIFVISATLNKLEELIKIVNPVFIKSDDFVPKKLENNFVLTSPLKKLEFLKILIEKYSKGKVIVFFNTCASVDLFFEIFFKFVFKENNLRKLHGKLQNREDIFEELLIKKDFVLFCTDIAARGIDIENVDCVIHFDIPLDPSNTIHRSGRTARNNKCGVSYLFVMPSELPFIKFLEFKKILINEVSLSVSEVSLSLNKGCAMNSDCAINSDSMNKDIDCSELKKFVRENSEVEKMAVKAFVSYLASYKEYVLNYLIEFKKLDFDSLAELFCLRKIPKMPELKHVVFKKFLRKKR